MITYRINTILLCTLAVANAVFPNRSNSLHFLYTDGSGHDWLVSFKNP